MGSEMCIRDRESRLPVECRILQKPCACGPPLKSVQRIGTVGEQSVFELVADFQYRGPDAFDDCDRTVSVAHDFMLPDGLRC